MPLAVDPKDPDEVLDYVIDWTARLGADTIVTSMWAIEDGTSVIDSNTFNGTSATVWLSGGAIGEKVLARNRVVTTGGRTMDQTISIKIKAK